VLALRGAVGAAVRIVRSVGLGSFHHDFSYYSGVSLYTYLLNACCGPP
jgi:hypothetical protein